MFPNTAKELSNLWRTCCYCYSLLCLCIALTLYRLAPIALVVILVWAVRSI